MTDPTSAPTPLDHPVWHSLSGRHAALALGDARAWRFRPEVNMFAAAADASPGALAALAALVPAQGALATVENAPARPLPGAVIEGERRLDQMVATRLNRGGRAVESVALGADDAAEMFELATLTAPGPFFPSTYLQGGYVGVRRGGRLVAMAGERMKVPGFTEVSAVCTHPDHRGQGYARALMEAVIAPLLEHGEGVFLHHYPDNPAVALYRSMGFVPRAAMTLTLYARV